MKTTVEVAKIAVEAVARALFGARRCHFVGTLPPPAHLRDTGVIIGGETQAETYGDYQREMDLLNAAFLDVLAEGDADPNAWSTASATALRMLPWSI